MNRTRRTPERTHRLGPGLLAAGLGLCLGSSHSLLSGPILAAQDIVATDLTATDARAELELGTKAFRERRYTDAENHFRLSLEGDATLSGARYLLARSIHAQVRTGNATPENVAQAQIAIEAYRVVLAADAAHEEAYQAVCALLAAVGDEEGTRAWIGERAGDARLTPARRSAAWTQLAQEEWSCHERKPESSEICVTRGIEAAWNAVAVDERNGAGWGFLGKLSRAAAASAARAGDSRQENKHSRLAGEAERRAGVLEAESRKEPEHARSY